MKNFSMRPKNFRQSEGFCAKCYKGFKLLPRGLRGKASIVEVDSRGQQKKANERLNIWTLRYATSRESDNVQLASDLFMTGHDSCRLEFFR
jgi:hypothetical protein